MLSGGGYITMNVTYNILKKLPKKKKRRLILDTLITP